MDLQTAEKLFQDAIKHLESEFSKMQVGRASTAMVDGLLVEAYGSFQPVKHFATISTPDPKTIQIQPWDKTILTAIERAIRERQDLGLNPLNDGHVIRIVLPMPTEERRKELVKVGKAKGEEARISVRNARHKALSRIQEQEKSKEISEDESHALQKDLQQSVDKANKKIEEVVKAKEKEIMTI